MSSKPCCGKSSLEARAWSALRHRISQRHPRRVKLFDKLLSMLADRLHYAILLCPGLLAADGCTRYKSNAQSGTETVTDSPFPRNQGLNADPGYSPSKFTNLTAAADDCHVSGQFDMATQEMLPISAARQASNTSARRTGYLSVTQHAANQQPHSHNTDSCRGENKIRTSSGFDARGGNSAIER